eukprot:1386568-Amorphochlora_amoeboformis.AAC.2
MSVPILTVTPAQGAGRPPGYHPQTPMMSHRMTLSLPDAVPVSAGTPPGQDEGVDPGGLRKTFPPADF